MLTLDLASVSIECEHDTHALCDGCECGCHDRPEPERYERDEREGPWSAS